MKNLWLCALVLSSCGLVAWPGKECLKHEDCSGLKEGYCSRAEICTRQCRNQGECPDGSTCTDVGRRSVCLLSCEEDSECGAAFRCEGQVCVRSAPFEPPAQ